MSDFSPFIAAITASLDLDYATLAADFDAAEYSYMREVALEKYREYRRLHPGRNCGTDLRVLENDAA